MSSFYVSKAATTGVAGTSEAEVFVGEASFSRSANVQDNAVTAITATSVASNAAAGILVYDNASWDTARLTGDSTLANDRSPLKMDNFWAVYSGTWSADGYKIPASFNATLAAGLNVDSLGFVTNPTAALKIKYFNDVLYYQVNRLIHFVFEAYHFDAPPTNFGSQNKFYYQVEGPTSFSQISSPLFNGVGINTVTGAAGYTQFATGVGALGQNNLLRNDGFNFGGATATATGTKATDSNVEFMQLIDSGTEPGLYTFTVKAGLLGQEMSKQIKVRIVEPKPVLDFVFVDYRSTATQSRVYDVVRSTDGLTVTLEKPFQDTLTATASWYLTLQNWMSAEATFAEISADTSARTEDKLLFKLDPNAPQANIDTEYWQENVYTLEGVERGAGNGWKGTPTTYGTTTNTAADFGSAQMFTTSKAYKYVNLSLNVTAPVYFAPLTDKVSVGLNHNQDKVTIFRNGNTSRLIPSVAEPVLPSLGQNAWAITSLGLPSSADSLRLYNTTGLAVTRATIAGTYTYTYNVDGLVKTFTVIIKEPTAKISVLNDVATGNSDVHYSDAVQSVSLGFEETLAALGAASSTNSIQLTNIPVLAGTLNLFGTGITGSAPALKNGSFAAAAPVLTNATTLNNTTGVLSVVAGTTANTVLTAKYLSLRSAPLASNKENYQVYLTEDQAASAYLFANLKIKDLAAGTYPYSITKTNPLGRVQTATDVITINVGNNQINGVVASGVNQLGNFDKFNNNWVIDTRTELEEAGLGLEFGDYTYEFVFNGITRKFVITVLDRPTLELDNITIGTSTTKQTVYGGVTNVALPAPGSTNLLNFNVKTTNLPSTVYFKVSTDKTVPMSTIAGSGLSRLTVTKEMATISVAPKTSTGYHVETVQLYGLNPLNSALVTWIGEAKLEYRIVERNTNATTALSDDQWFGNSTPHALTSSVKYPIGTDGLVNISLNTMTPTSAFDSLADVITELALQVGGVALPVADTMTGTAGSISTVYSIVWRLDGTITAHGSIEADLQTKFTALAADASTVVRVELTPNVTAVTPSSRLAFGIRITKRNAAPVVSSIAYDLFNDVNLDGALPLSGTVATEIIETQSDKFAEGNNVAVRVTFSEALKVGSAPTIRFLHTDGLAKYSGTLRPLVAATTDTTATVWYVILPIKGTNFTGLIPVVSGGQDADNNPVNTAGSAVTPLVVDNTLGIIGAETATTTTTLYFNKALTSGAATTAANYTATGFAVSARVYSEDLVRNIFSVILTTDTDLADGEILALGAGIVDAGGTPINTARDTITFVAAATPSGWAIA